MKRILVLLTVLLIVRALCAQQHALAKQWDKRFGGINDEEATSFQQTSDGGYIIGGWSNSGISGNKTQSNWDTALVTNDYWVIKIDVVGNKQWDKRFGTTGDDFLFSLQQTIDGGYILGGFSFSGINGDKTQPGWGGADYWVVKIDSLGNKQWDKRFGGTNDDDLYSVIQTNDRGYILGGFSNSGISGDKTQSNWDPNDSYDDFWVVKIDSVGNKQWDKRFGGIKEDGLGPILQTADGGYILGGGSSSDSSGDKTQNSWAGSIDYWVVKIDSVGNKQWDKRYGGNGDDGLSSIIQTKDKGYILGGTSYSDNSGDKTQNYGGYWLVKIDSLGNKLWDKAFDGLLGLSVGSELVNVSATENGGYLLSGVSNSNAGRDKTESSFGLPQGWLVKIDSFGNKEWDKTIYTIKGGGGSAIETNDHCYAMISSINSGIGDYKSQPNWDSNDSTDDYWIIKFCDTLISDIKNITDKVQLSIYPNPFATDIAIAIQKENLHAATFTITNPLGQIIYTQQETNLSPSYTKMLDLSYLPNGVYFVTVVVDGEKVTREIVKSGP